MSDFQSSATVQARKAHQCLYCYGKIRKDEYHHRQGGMWEGEWQDWRMHLDCLDAHGRENDEMNGNGEICQEPHQRGRTCGETEEERFKFEADLGQFIKEHLEKGGGAISAAREVLRDVEEWQELEAARVEAARKPYMAAKKGA